MRIEQIKIYKFYELSEKSQDRAIELYNADNYEIHWQSEIIESFKAIFKTANIDLIDYSVSIYGHSFIKFDLDDCIKELSGVRAYAWLENNLFYKLRISRSDWIKNRKNYLSYGSDYRQGKIKPCPLTGYYFDDTLIDSFKNNIFKHNYNLNECFQDLLFLTVRELESKYEAQRSKEYLADFFEANEFEFLENGTMA